MCSTRGATTINTVRNRKLGSNWFIAKSFDTLREKETLEDPFKSILRPNVHKVCCFRRLFREKFKIVQITDLSIIRTLMGYKLQPTGSSPKEIRS